MWKPSTGSSGIQRVFLVRSSRFGPQMLHAVLLVVVVVGVCARVTVVTGASARDHNGNFLDDKWTTAGWDKFRDEVEEPGSWNPGKPFDQALDPAKDPCLKVDCGAHQKCVSEDYKTPTCVSLNSLKNFKPALLKCKRCPLVRHSPVCGTDRRTYPTKCQMDYQACVSKMPISVKCSGPCPCPAQINKSVEKKECSDGELNAVASRLTDWMSDLHRSNNKKLKFNKSEQTMAMNKVPICKGSLGWMFTRLDVNFDLHLDQSEVASLGLGKSDVCTTAFLSACDMGRDQLISSQEWCSCFQRHQEAPCRAEITRIHKWQAGKKLLGQYFPSCDEDGFYKPHQCQGSSGQCWCVDRYGNEVAGSRRMGLGECVAAVEASGEPGSGDSLLSDDEDDDIMNDQEDIGDDEDDDDDGDDVYFS